MPTGKKNVSIQEEEDPGGAPEWMVTFSDCMTLLLTFFVLLLSFSSFDKETLPALGQSLAKALPSIGLSGKDKQDSVYEKQPSSQEVKGDRSSLERCGTNDEFYEREKTPGLSESESLHHRIQAVFLGTGIRFFQGRARGS